MATHTPKTEANGTWVTVNAMKQPRRRMTDVAGVAQDVSGDRR